MGNLNKNPVKPNKIFKLSFLTSPGHSNKNPENLNKNGL
jgi:hypothetical protein